MSFESGRMSGLVGSLILVIAPVIMVGLNGVLLFTFYSTIISAITNAGQLAVPNFSPVLLSAISLAIVALAILCLIGFMLLIIAMYRLSLYYNEPDIFKNTLYGLIVSIVGAISLVIVVIAFLVFSMGRISPPTTSSAAFAIIGEFILGFLAIVITSFVIGITSSLFYMRALNKLGDKSDIHSFNTAGLLILIGTVVPGVGGIIAWIGLIFAASGFHSLKPKPTETKTAINTTANIAPAYSKPPLSQPSPNPATSTTQKKICPFCGAENNPISGYCWSCGRSLQVQQ